MAIRSVIQFNSLLFALHRRVSLALIEHPIMNEAPSTQPPTPREKKQDENHISGEDVNNQHDIDAEEKNVIGDVNPLPDL